MADEQPDKATDLMPKSAVEVDEKDLDKAEGGLSAYGVLKGKVIEQRVGAGQPPSNSV